MRNKVRVLIEAETDFARMQVGIDENSEHLIYKFVTFYRTNLSLSLFLSLSPCKSHDFTCDMRYRKKWNKFISCNDNKIAYIFSISTLF